MRMVGWVFNVCDGNMQWLNNVWYAIAKHCAAVTESTQSLVAQSSYHWLNTLEIRALKSAWLTIDSGPSLFGGTWSRTLAYKLDMSFPTLKHIPSCAYFYLTSLIYTSTWMKRSVHKRTSSLISIRYALPSCGTSNVPDASVQSM